MGTIKRTFANSLTGTGKLSATSLDSNIPAANIADASVTNVTTLPDAVGQAIKSVAGSPPSQALGDIWYNSVTGTLKNYTVIPDAWSSGGNLSNTRFQALGAGTQTDGLYALGYDIFTGADAFTEEYDGSTWTAGGNASNARWSAYGGGTQTAAFAAGGFNPVYTPPSGGSFQHELTEEYNGSSWTSGGNLNQKRSDGDGTGTQTAGLLSGGGGYGVSPGTVYTNTEEYNGTSWTNATAMPVGKTYHQNIGIQTAALAVGGQNAPSPAAVTDTLEYDGSSWTTGGSLGTAKKRMGSAGIQTSAMVFSGATGPANGLSPVMEEYDGTSWTTNPATLSTNNYEKKGAGTTAAALGMGGYFTTATEEYSEGFTGITTVTTS